MYISLTLAYIWIKLNRVYWTSLKSTYTGLINKDNEKVLGKVRHIFLIKSSATFKWGRTVSQKTQKLFKIPFNACIDSYNSKQTAYLFGNGQKNWPVVILEFWFFSWARHTTNPVLTLALRAESCCVFKVSMIHALLTLTSMCFLIAPT